MRVLNFKMMKQILKKSLNTNALQYATGEKNKASSAEDKVLYEDIIQILIELCKLKNGGAQFSNGEAPANAMSPSQLADVHRITQKTIQNQIAIKKLAEENEGLKKEVQQLKQEIERFKPWILYIEKWIYTTSPNAAIPVIPPPQQPLVTVEETEETASKKEKKKRTSTVDSIKTPTKTEKTEASRKESASPASARPKSVHGAKSTTLRSSSDKPKKIIKKEKSIGSSTPESPEKEPPIKSPKKKNQIMISL